MQRWEGIITGEFDQIRELRQRFIRAVYDLRDPRTGIAYSRDIKPRMRLNSEEFSDDDQRYIDVALYFDQLGYVDRQSSGYGMVSITARGVQYVEGDLQPQQSPRNVTFNV